METTQLGNLNFVKSFDADNLSKNLCVKFKQFYDSFGKMTSQKKKDECAKAVEKWINFFIDCFTKIVGEYLENFDAGIIDSQDYIVWNKIMRSSSIIRWALYNKSKYSRKAQIFRDKCEKTLIQTHRTASDMVKYIEKYYDLYNESILK